MTPPSGRLRKPRLTRMDAAIDAMQPLGFPKRQIRKTVKGLLKEYGGHEGWPFIEADAYKLLIDTILDEQEGVVGEERNEEENLLLNGALGDKRLRDCSVAADPGPSAQALPPISSEVADAAALTRETGGDQLLIAEGDKEGGDGLVQGMQLDTIAKSGYVSGEGMHIDSPALQSHPPLIPPPPPANGLPRRRKPCYGWISSGDEDDDFIYLTPAPRLRPGKTRGQVENRVSETHKREKRKSRWDVKP